jgi:hypothetical protein
MLCPSKQPTRRERQLSDEQRDADHLAVKVSGMAAISPAPQKRSTLSNEALLYLQESSRYPRLAKSAQP